MKLDDVDLDIVRILHEDGRSSYSDISKIIGVSAGTVRNRIARMRSSGMLSFDVWLDPHRTGLGVHATLLMKIQPRRLAEAADALASLDETAYVATLVGAYDIVADVFCRDMMDLRRLIHDKVQQIEGVVDVSTNLVTENKHQAKAQAPRRAQAATALLTGSESDTNQRGVLMPSWRADAEAVSPTK